MGATYYRDVSALLSQHGFAKTNGGKGSHEKWCCERTGKLVIVPFNLKSRHTANGILQSAGIAKSF
jgi:predicted RNA binding protein YcfA (HicA-like mRNA interferase family)